MTQTSKPTQLAGLFPLLLAACATTSGEAPEFGRAGLSADTGTTAYGTFEVEVGFEADPGDSKGVPLKLKYGNSEQTELYLDLSVYEKIDMPGGDGEGIGDLGLGVRHRFWEGSAGTSSALEGRVKFPTGDEGEGTSTGKVDFFAAGMLTQEFESLVLNGYFELGVLGDATADDTDVQRTLAISWSAPAAKGLGTFGELSQVYSDELDPAALLLGMFLPLSSTTVFDFGVSFGLNGDAPGGVLFVGLTTNLGILGPQGPRRYEDSSPGN
jgi:hypothetical protein